MQLKAWGKRFNGECQVFHSVADVDRVSLEEAFLADEIASIREKARIAEILYPIILGKMRLEFRKKCNLN